MKLSLNAGRHIVKTNSRIIPVTLLLLLALAFLFAAAFFVQKAVSKKIHNSPSITMLSDKWNTYDYQAVFDTATVLLEKQPFNNTVLTYRGYAAFYLAVSATEPAASQAYIDEAIRCLRLSAMHAKKKTLLQVEYMLGKAYFYKDSISSYHYYADQAVNYLRRAKEAGYGATDIPEYLGLSYAQLNMTMESIAAFSEALLVRESDTLLLSIAEQYFKAGQYSASKQYLFQIVRRSSDDSLVQKSRILLARILLLEDNFEEAQKEYEAVLEKDEDVADAHYGLGLV